MRVFVTGASGFIGTATVRELLAHKHTVLGLCRSPANAATLTALGADIHNGSLEDLESLKSGAAQCDGIIHLGFITDFADPNFDFGASCVKDRAAIEAMGSAIEGTGKPLAITSGILLLKKGEMRTEDDKPDTEGFAALRGASEKVTLAMVTRGVRAMVVRLAPTVHGEGDKGFVPMLIAAARKEGVSTYIGEGMNRWTAVHRLDVGRLYRLALEKGTGGKVYHGVAEESVTAKDIAEAIGQGLNVPVGSKTLEEAVGKLGFVGNAFSSDSPASNKKTREELGWNPEQPTLTADIEKSYFK